jgi:ppGpp synthetase/RelA/SpoT-type nucleotidyltranferase
MTNNTIESCLESARVWRNNVDAIFEELLFEKLQGIHVQKRGRVKSRDSLEKKIAKKSLEKKAYNLSNVTDIVGFRFVCHFSSEVEQVVEALLDKIRYDNSRDFDELLEARIYVSSAANQQSLKERLGALFERYDVPVQLDVKASRYTSVHLVIRKKPGQVFEVQVRNVFEDAWSEIEHALKYKAGDAELSPSVDRHLQILNTFTQACSEYSENILADTTNARVVKPEINELDYDAEELKNLPSEISPVLSEAYELRKNGNYKKAISKLSDFMAERTDLLTKGSAVEYYVVMERGLCYMFAMKTQAAIADYESLVENHSERALIYFRLADAHRIEKNLKESILYLELIPGKLTSQINTARERKVLQTYPLLLANAYWRIKEPHRALQVLDMARTAGALEPPYNVDGIVFVNCYAYYRMDAAKHLGSKVPKPELQGFYDQLIGLKVKSGQYWNALDTFMMVCMLLEKDNEAKECADLLEKMVFYPEDGDGKPSIRLLDGGLLQAPLEDIETVRFHIDRIRRSNGDA